MLWSRAKTILIVFLLCTNVFLLSILITSEYKRTRVKDEVVDACVEILNSRDIEIDAKLVPKFTGNAYQYTVENAVSGYDAFANSVLGDDAVKIDGGYQNDKATVAFEGDTFKIKFSGGFETGDKHRSPAEKVRAYLNTIGIDASDAETSVSNDSKGIFTVSFVKKIDRAPLFDCCIKARLDGKRIIDIEGSWFVNSAASAPKYELESAPGLLVGYVTSGQIPRGTQIEALEFGYCINENGIFHMQSTLTPVYEVRTSAGEKYYIDARVK